ncbi:MAG: electron transfer flavoprotein subunit beta [Chloroflexi bacterium]|nr:electron transfer flavoprotein subunit beta [Chloroflexota bacterium]
MNYIVLVKQVPDIKHIPDEAWDWERGTLKRAFLDNVCNELDKQALAFAIRMRESSRSNRDGGKVVALTMGPNFADEVLTYAMCVGADAGVLLTDRKLGGADTAATAHPLGQAIRKIEKEIFNGDRNYIIFSGMQSVDGDTAQVPAQVAEELGIAQIAYATSFSFVNDELRITRITRRGSQTVAPMSYPCMVTVTDWTHPLNASFVRTRWAASQKLYTWSAADVNCNEARIGLTGSRTTVFRIFPPRDVSKRKCVMESDAERLAQLIKEAYVSKLASTEEAKEEAVYHLPEGKTPSYQGEVWVYAEQEGKEINAACFELLGKAVNLAQQLNEKVGAVLVGDNIRALAKELIAYGADKVYLVEHPRLTEFLPVPYGRAVSQLVEKYLPQIILFSATPLGREMAPRVAYRSNSGLTADCTSLDIVDFKRGQQELYAILRQTRPALGGNIMASIITQHSRVQMATVRPGVMRALKPDYRRVGEVVEYSTDITDADLGVKIISSEFRPFTSEIKDAAAIVCGGAGCKTKEGFDRYIRPLAESMGKSLGTEVMVGGSRAAVEAGFIDRSHQIGQTGQTVKPRIYIGVGVSGAVQHLTGMQNSDIIVVINKDPGAPMFRVCDFGIVGNMEDVVPKLAQAFSAVKVEVVA